MNCIIVADSADQTGGVSSVLLSQAQGLTLKGFKVFVFAAYGPIAPSLLEWAEDIFVLYPQFSRRGKLTEIWNTTASNSLNAYLEKFSATDSIIHIHSLSMGLSPSIATALKARKIKYVITAHDAGWVCPTGYFFNFQKNEYCTFKPLSTSCITCNCDKKTYLHKVYKLAKAGTLDYISKIKNHASVILSPSALLTEKLIERAPKETPVITLLNPVNSHKDEYSLPKGNSFLFVGRIWEEKGINELLETIGNDYPLTIVGDGPRKNDLQEKYPKVHFKGWLSPADVLLEMKNSIALILPSIYLEAFGLVVTEALSLGLPVIVSNRAGSATMIENGHNGFIIDMNHLNELNDCCDALTDKELFEIMSKNAYDTYWENPLSTERYISGLSSIFTELMKI